MQRCCVIHNMYNWPCKGNESKSTCLGCFGRLGWLPAPSPLFSVTRRRRGGGGGGIAGWVLPGNSERGRGVTLASLFCGLRSRLILAEENRVFIPRSKRASQFGISFWLLHSADFFRGSIWQIHSVGKFGKFIQRVLEKGKQSKEKKSKACIFCRPVMSHHRHCI
jgi:hypothetical protein